MRRSAPEARRTVGTATTYGSRRTYERRPRPRLPRRSTPHARTGPPRISISATYGFRRIHKRRMMGGGGSSPVARLDWDRPHPNWNCPACARPTDPEGLTSLDRGPNSTVARPDGDTRPVLPEYVSTAATCGSRRVHHCRSEAQLPCRWTPRGAALPE